MVDKSDWILMPRTLTAENGAKGEMIGEFKEQIEIPNPNFCDCNVGDSCDDCDEPIYFTQDVVVSWETIKAIYKKAVEIFENQ